jgi:methionyl-tRNA formyltransferase
MRIIFMGTPDFAVPSLRVLHESGHEVAAVVTSPDRPAGRGLKTRASSVKQFAEANGIHVLQPEKLKDVAFLERLQSLNADLFVIVAFRKLPEAVWSIPSQGTFNLHASLLPDYRGAAPINWVLINGETKTGATTFMIDEKIDTGAILLQESLEIQPDWNAGDLHDSLMITGANLVLRTVEGLAEGKVKAKPQDHTGFIHKAPKIFPEDCVIDWQQPTETIRNFIRGLSPFPCARTELNGKTFKIFSAHHSELEEKGSPGDLFADVRSGELCVRCGDGWLRLERVQLEGKKRMETADFIRGFKDPLNTFGPG